MRKGNFNLNDKLGVKYLTVPSFERYKGLVHCFTTRLGGKSEKPYESMNMGKYTDDEKVKENYVLLAESLGIDSGSFYFAHQIHSSNVAVIREKPDKDSDFFSHVFEDTDALVTNLKGVCLCILAADCVPILIYDPVKSVIGAAHSGWKGTAKKISKKVISVMHKEYGTNPEDCIAAVGPSIGKCCYEVDDYVIDKFKSGFSDTNKFVLSKGNGKYMLDLWKVNEMILQEAGIKKENITVSNLCTKCNNDMFYSYRGENGKTGRAVAVIEMREHI